MQDVACARVELPPHVELVKGYDGTWRVDDLQRRRRFVLDRASLLVLAAVAAGAANEDEVLDLLGPCDGLGAPAVARRLRALLDRDLLRHAGAAEAPAAWAEDLLRDWRRHHWHAAARYHLSTYDYPFIDYSAALGGFSRDRGRMADYLRREPDLARAKSYPGARRRQLPFPNAALLPSPARMVGLDAPPAGVDPTDAVTKVLSMTFGSIGELPRGSARAAPDLRRTSPSGGARHPCEGYLLSLGLPGLDRGIYHAMTTDVALELVGPAPADADLARLFPATWVRAPFEVLAVIVVTCVFERNMYRYREPRTFRTVHMDAGHLAATAELAASSLGLEAMVEYRDDEQAVEAAIGLDFLEEGYMLAIALGLPEAGARDAEEGGDDGD